MNALASGCSSCDGQAIYATITKFLTNAHWYDDAEGLIIEDLTGLTHPVVNQPVTVYAYYTDKTPRKLANSEWTLAQVGTATGVTVDDTNKVVSATSAGSFVISATGKNAAGTAISTLVTNKQVTVL